MTKYSTGHLSKAKQLCPVCLAEVEPYARYPRYLCESCARYPLSVDGRPVEFGNINISGGFEGWYSDTGERYESHECFVNGTACYADEARFGGIVIKAIVDPPIQKVGRFSVSDALRREWRAGRLHHVWKDRYPCLFDSDDVRLADSRHTQGRHFCEWWSAILLHHMTGYHCLVAKYEF